MTSNAQITIKSIARRAVIDGLSFKEAQDRFVAIYLTDVLHTTDDSRVRTADVAGIRREHVQRLIKKHNLPYEDVLIVDAEQGEQ